MAHHRYQTEAIVLGSVPRGESSRSFFLLTKDLGFIGASAQGVRSLSSKLKGGLSDFSYAHVDLIRGADMWRIVDVEERGVLFSRMNAHAQRSYARFASLLRRFLHGERIESKLFFDVLSLRSYLHTHACTEEELHALELAMAVKMLCELGYGGTEEEIVLVSDTPLSEPLVSYAGQRRKALSAFVRRRIQESHL